jgi:hypothetical protein
VPNNLKVICQFGNVTARGLGVAQVRAGKIAGFAKSANPLIPDSFLKLKKNGLLSSSACRSDRTPHDMSKSALFQEETPPGWSAALESLC